MIRNVVDDLYQVGESVSGNDSWREAVRVYVLLNDDCPLLFDAGSHIHRESVMTDLKELLGDTAPGYVFLTHTELPHTGNMSAIAKTWPEIKFVVSSGILPHVELPWWVAEEQVEYGYAGTDGEYGGRAIAFSDGILKDQPGTHWMFDDRTGTLFTADAFGYFFPDSAEQMFDDEMEDGIPQEWFHRYHESVFRFLPLVPGYRVNDDIDKVFAKRNVNVIAPTHGNAIRGNVPVHVRKINQVMLEICK